jgi:uncharacterized protein
VPSRWACSLAALLLGLAAGCGGGLPAGHVDDRAGLLDAAGRERLETFHRLLLADHDIDYQLVTVRDAGDLEQFAVAAFDQRATGRRSRSGRGLLLVVDPVRDRVRLEVAAALEGVYVDAFIAYLEQRQMVPFFRRGRIADGILATTELIVTQAQNAARNAGFDAEPWAAFTTGAGATSAARIGQGDTGAWRNGPADVSPASDTPGAVVAAYLDAMAQRNANPALPIYSTATRELLADWVVTPAQMDNVAKTYAGCHAEAPRLDGDRAVVRYPPGERACAPWFLVREQGRWRLDLTLMQRVVRFGRSNAWHFAPGVAHPYAFAFADWRFDRHGFPRIE